MGETTYVFRETDFAIPSSYRKLCEGVVGMLLVTTQDFIKFWGKIFAFVLLVLIENLQRFKFFF
jgi:hypothetical protein